MLLRQKVQLFAWGTLPQRELWSKQPARAPGCLQVPLGKAETPGSGEEGMKGCSWVVLNCLNNHDSDWNHWTNNDHLWKEPGVQDNIHLALNQAFLNSLLLLRPLCSENLLVPDNLIMIIPDICILDNLSIAKALFDGKIHVDQWLCLAATFGHGNQKAHHCDILWGFLALRR